MADTDVLIDRGILMRDIMVKGHHETKREITAKQLASELGLSPHTIRKYTRGEANADLHVWSKLYAMTRDRRIPELVCGNVEVMVLDLPDKFNPDIAELQRLASTITAHARHVEAAMTILADGRIDAKDRPAVIELLDNLEPVLHSHFKSAHGIVAQYEKNTGRKLL